MRADSITLRAAMISPVDAAPGLCGRIVRCSLALLVATLALSPDAGLHAAEDGERLLLVEPEGWHEVYAEREENLSTTEYVPADQDAESWREMFTVQVVVDLADADPDAVLSNIARHMTSECPGLAAHPIELGGVGDDYPTLAVMLLCGERADGDGGEVSLLRGIAGHENFYLLRKTWRTKAYGVDDEPPVALEARKFWLGYLAWLRICDAALNNCPAVPAGDE